MLGLSDLKVKLFTDGADKTQILEMAAKPWIKGFTTNPSLLKKGGRGRPPMWRSWSSTSWKPI
jgi:transaldolase